MKRVVGADRNYKSKHQLIFVIVIYKVQQGLFDKFPKLTSDEISSIIDPGRLLREVEDLVQFVNQLKLGGVR